MNHLIRLLIYFFYKTKASSPVIYLPSRFFFKFLCIFVGVDIHWSTNIGKGLKMHHGFGIVIHKNAILGENVTIRNGVVIGVKQKGLDDAPTIGDNVDLGAQSIILGKIKIANNAVIGAGAVITKNVNSDEVWVGNPARKIK